MSFAGIRVVFKHKYLFIPELCIKPRSLKRERIDKGVSAPALSRFFLGGCHYAAAYTLPSQLLAYEQVLYAEPVPESLPGKSCQLAAALVLVKYADGNVFRLFAAAEIILFEHFMYLSDITLAAVARNT